VGAPLVEQPGTGISPPRKPSVWRVGWATFLGYLCTVLLGLPLVLALYWVGIDTGGHQSAGRGVFIHYDVWSWLAEGCVGLLATFVTAMLVGWQLRERTGWEVPFGFAFLTLLLTGYAPLLALTPLYAATAPVSLVAATLILRWRCEPSGGEPRKTLAAVPRRYRRAVAIALAVAGPLMLAYVFAYGATHPLRQDWRSDSPLQQHKPGKLTRYQLYLENRGPGVLRDVQLVQLEGSPVFQLERIGNAANKWDIYADGEITLELRQGRFCPPGIAKLDAVRLSYTTFGGRFEQRVPLTDPPRVRCG
jgi:hypothetical protein